MDKFRIEIGILMDFINQLISNLTDRLSTNTHIIEDLVIIIIGDSKKI